MAQIYQQGYGTGIAKALSGYGSMLSGAQDREIREAQNARAQEQSERAKDDFDYQKSLRDRNDVEFTKSANRAAEQAIRSQNQEKRLQDQEDRAKEDSIYNIGLRPTMEARATAQEQRLQNQDARYQQASDIQATQEGERVIQNYNKQLLGQLAKTESYGLDDPTEIKDPMGLAQERPELIKDMLDRHKRYQFADIDGQRVEIDVIGFTVTDNAVIPRIANAETGEELTPTLGGTNNDTDPVLMQTHEQFSRLVNNELLSALNNGGDQSSVYQSMLIKTGGMTADRERRSAEQKVRDKLIEENTSQYANSAEATRAYMGVVTEASMDDLLQIYQDQGGDPAALEAELKVNKDADRSQLDRTINPIGDRAVGPATQQRMDMLGMTRTGEYDLMQEIERTTSDLRSAGGKSGFMDDQSAEDYKLNTAAEKWYDANTADLAIKMFNNPAIKKKFDELEPAEFFKQYGVDTAGGQVEPKNMLASIQPPPFELTRENVIAAIADQSKQPTEQQRLDMVQFLKDRGLVTDAKFREGIEDSTLPSEEAAAAIWTAASFSSGTPTERRNMAQELLNLAVRGDTKLGTAQQSVIDDRKTTREATTKNRAAVAAAKLEATELKQAQTDAAAYFDIYQAKIAGEEPSKDQAREVSRTLPGVMRKLKQSKSLAAKRELLSAINPALSTILQGNAVKEGAWEKFTGLFDGDVDLGQVSDFNLEFVRMGDDKTIVYAPPGGQAGKPVPLSLLMDTDANVAKLLKLAAEINGG